MDDTVTRRHSLGYLLNKEPDPDLGTTSNSSIQLQAGKASKTAAARNVVPKQTNTFAFVNISDPLQAGDAENRKFVRQYVRPVKSNPRLGSTSRAGSSNHGSAKDQTDAVGLESGSNPFIIMSHPDQGSNAGTRKFVKQNAQRRFRKDVARKSTTDEVEDGKVKEVSVATVRQTIKPVLLPKSATATTKPPLANDAPEVEESVSMELKKVTRGERLQIWAQNVNVDFWAHVNTAKTIFPIDMNPEAYRVVEYLHTSARITFVPPGFVPAWFGLIVHDPSAFQGLLSLALNHQRFIHKLPTEQSFAHYHTKALRSVHNRLSDSVESTSPGVITSVLMFTIHDILVFDAERYAINREGLRRIIKLRGGIETLDDVFAARFFVLVSEMCGAYNFNYKPDFYGRGAFNEMPRRVSKIPLTNRLRWLVATWQDKFPDRKDVLDALKDFHALNSLVTLEYPTFWLRNTFLSPDVYLLIARFFELLDHPKPEFKGLEIERSLCWAVLFYMNIMREALGDYFTSIDARILAAAKDTIIPEREDWAGLEGMRLWCLVQAGIVATGEDRKEYLLETRKMMRIMNCKDWNAVMGIIGELIYLELIFGQRCEAYGLEIMAGWQE